MATLTVGADQQFSTIAAAVNASGNGDIINVMAGTYTNDFVSVSHDLSLNAIGGTVTMNATVQCPNGKAILTEGGAGVTVSIDGFAFENATVRDQNGAGIRYEGGTLHITNSGFFNNQNGILGAADPNGVITIDHSEFGANGAGGDGHTHNMYIGDINSFSLTNSFSHDANVGHEVKSRAANNTIINNTILDNNSSASYQIDLPNGGNAVVSGNTIQKGPYSQNPNVIAYGEEGNTHAGTSLVVSNNTIVNDQRRGPALWNATGNTATFADNKVFGFGGNLVNGAASQSNTTVLASRPTLVEAVPSAPAPVRTPAPVVNLPVPSATSGLVLSLSEDAYQGDAQFTLSVDGQQIGGTRTAAALHSAGATQQVVIGGLPTGSHQIGVSFINDLYAGTAQTDRNLYLDSAYYNGQVIRGSTAALMSNGTVAFVATGDVAPAPVTSTPAPVVAAPAPIAPTSTPVATPAPAPAKGLVVNISEDYYQGDAQYTITVDGQQIGGTRTATASHGAGQSEQVMLGALSTGPHQIGVIFLNDKYAGTPQTDRNLYVDSATYDGKVVSSSSLALMSGGEQDFTASGPAAVTPPAPVTPVPTLSAGLVVNVAEDAYLGDAQFVATVDGKQIGGVQTATALHNAGQSQAISLGTVQPGHHQFGITFLNDAYGGSPQLDRNLYVTGASYNDQAIPAASTTLLWSGTANFGFTSGLPATSTAVINVSEDAYQGNAQFTVAVDGQQQGGVYTATASHSAGQSQEITLSGLAEQFTSHDIAVTFLNDKWDGTPQTDRNLYVNSIQFDGQTVPGSAAALMSNGTDHFTTPAPANWTV